MTAAAAAKESLTIAVALVALSDLAPYERNARTHPQAQVDQIKASIRQFGFTNPILADLDDGGLIAAGHGRHLAVEQMVEAGETVKLPNGKALPAGTVPVIDCSGWTRDQRRAYTLADNKIAENSGWDEDLLKIEIGELLELEPTFAPVLGFSDEELAALVSGISGGGEGGEDDGNYSRKIEAPIYEPKGDKPAIGELIDTSRSEALAAEIDKAKLSRGHRGLSAPRGGPAYHLRFRADRGVLLPRPGEGAEPHGAIRAGHHRLRQGDRERLRGVERRGRRRLERGPRRCR